MESRVVGPAIWLVLILLFSLPLNLNSPRQQDQYKAPVIEPVDNTVTSYTTHGVIRTHGDSELYDLAIADNWPGFGNSTHPWIIEDYYIEGDTPIQISWTDYYFIIRDCFLLATTSGSGFGIRILDTDYPVIENCTITSVDFAWEGIEFWNVRWGTIRNCSIYYFGEFGIYLRYAQYCNIYDSMVHDNLEVGINVHESEHMTLENNMVFDNGREGILVSHESGWTSDYLTLRNNTISYNGGPSYPGLSIVDTHYVTATDMTIHSNYVGVLVQDSDGFSFTDSRIFQNYERGVDVNASDSGTFRNNAVSHNDNSGLVLAHSDDWEVTSNLVLDNAGHGLELYETTNTLLFFNDIGWNDLSNAVDTGSGTNDWSYGNTGNWWHDYTGGVYNIPGGAVDNYPSHSCIGYSNGPLDVQWEAISAVLNWSANALHPVSYEAYQNGTLMGAGTWDGSDIIVPVNATTLGYYECTIVAYHISGHNTTRTTSVTIGDWLAPTWEFTPQDIIILLGTDLFFQFAATDQSAIGGWGVNDTLNFEISANGLLTNRGVLDIGVYGVNASVHDIYGNTQYITIRIFVIREIPPSNIEYLLAVSGLFGAVGAALVVSMGLFVSKVRAGKLE